MILWLEHRELLQIVKVCPVCSKIYRAGSKCPPCGDARRAKQECAQECQEGKE